VATTGSSKSPKSAKPDKKATAPAKKAAPVKKPAAKKPAAKKPAAKKAATKKAAPASKSTPAKKTAASGSATPAKKETAISAASRIEIRIPVERQKAAQAAGNFGFDELPGPLADQPAAAIRIGKGASPVTSRSETCPDASNGITQAATRAGHRELRQVGGEVGLRFQPASCRKRDLPAIAELLPPGHRASTRRARIRICLMGHAGQGHEPQRCGCCAMTSF
jgi:hypothetical protein